MLPWGVLLWVLRMNLASLRRVQLFSSPTLSRAWVGAWAASGWGARARLSLNREWAFNGSAGVVTCTHPGGKYLLGAHDGPGAETAA